MAVSQIPSWVSDYVGIEWRAGGRVRETGLDCWGLARLVLAERFGVELPEWVEPSEVVDDRARVAGAINSRRPGWETVQSGDERGGDLVLLKMGGDESHIGILVSAKTMLHSMREFGAVIEDIRSPRWARRIAGIYRRVAA